jgi:hypothetical protein
MLYIGSVTVTVMLAVLPPSTVVAIIVALPGFPGFRVTGNDADWGVVGVTDTILGSLLLHITF